MSQRDRIIKELRKAGKRGVTNHHFSNNMRILDYTARISELRHDGYEILAVQQRMFMSKKLSGTFKYYLIGEPEN